MTTKHKIEIEGLPEGWKAVAYRVPLKDEYIFDQDAGVVVDSSLRTPAIRLIVEKIHPRRIVLEDTCEIRKPKEGEYVYNNGNLCLCRKPERWGHEHQIWREVKEGEGSTTFRE